MHMSRCVGVRETKVRGLYPSFLHPSNSPQRPEALCMFVTEHTGPVCLPSVSTGLGSLENLPRVPGL